MTIQVRGDGQRVQVVVVVEWQVLIAFVQALVATVVVIFTLLALLERYGIVLM